MEAPTVEWQIMQDWSVRDLLETIKFRGDEEAISWSKAAFVNLVFHFREDLFKKCVLHLQKIGGTETDAEELTNRVFERFYKYPNTFDLTESPSDKPDVAFQYYLFGIAKRELFDMIHPDESPYDGTEEVITTVVDSNKEYQPEQLAALQEAEARIDAAFAHLTPKHKIIYLTYYYQEKEGRYLPARLRKKLVDVLGGLSQSTIRVYKKQAFEAIKLITDGQK